jgi:mannose-6-phosphate isomerase-like protein (cupin superfamily)
MHVTRYAQAVAYEARGHFNMTGLRLQGMEVSPSKDFWVGLSHFLPAGGAESSASNAEKVYVVLSGEITVVTDEGESTLGPLDSCFLAAGERRSIINRSNLPAAMVVIMSYLPATA